LRHRLIEPGSFVPERHFYPRVLNAQIHALPRFFLSLGNARVADRYAHLNPGVDKAKLLELLATRPKHFRWAGADLMHVTDDSGRRRMVVIETNSCPSGNKSMPLYEEHDEYGGYRQLLERTFLPRLKSRKVPDGELAVVFDKNEMEASGYAATLADLTNERVHLARWDHAMEDPPRLNDDGILELAGRPIRCAFRYVTQRPWSRMPLTSRTLFLNPLVACLAGGRNKTVAAKAYDLFNADMRGAGLRIRTPTTFWDVAWREVPLRVELLGGQAVVKIPYSNAGQGVFTITNPGELEAFRAREHTYDRYLVQSLIGNSGWSSMTEDGRLFHVGTVPDKKGRTYAMDLRFMVSAGTDGFRPLAIYARRAREPMTATLSGAEDSWEMLGTNLSVMNGEGWGSDTERLLLVDRRDFNRIGIGLDDLIEAYLQSVMATIAIDRMAQRLLGRAGFRHKLFSSLVDDERMVAEIARATPLEAAA
jgi:hypothetical protein